MATIDRARRIAGNYLSTRGYGKEAEMVRHGAGDDFVEVRVALHLIDQEEQETRRYRTALELYAEPEFWDYGSADEDQGRLARDALAGREPAMLPRD
jgi:hypothetical protein